MSLSSVLRALAQLGATAACLAASSLPGAASTPRFPGTVGARTHAASASGTTTSPWPEFLMNAFHTAYDPSATITTANASTLGVTWMANLYSADLGSDAIAYNATLGEMVVYVGNERGDVFAINAATGQEIWSTNLSLGGALRDSPLVASDGSVWIGSTFDAAMYKLNGATGAVECSIKSPNGLALFASPMEATPPGGVATVYWSSIDANTQSGPEVATNESNCAQIFTFSKYRTGIAGPWASPAYGVDGNGEPLVIFGTADIDSTEYAIDANTGALVWQTQLANPSPYSYDIGDGATISPPGNNGFADGMVYVDTKYGVEYGLDMNTGQPVWTFDMYPSGYTGARDAIASAALDGNTLVFGYLQGVYSLNATTGTENWQFGTSAEALSSPAILGQTGSEVATVGDLTGAIHVLGVASGNQLYSYQTGGYITSSPAAATGAVTIASSDGFLYALAPGGSNAAPPSAAVTSPANGVSVANPDGNVAVTGSASDATSVANVEVAVQSGGSTGPWYNATTGIWGSAPFRNAATLASSGAASSTWSFSFPVPASGGSYEVFANAVNSGNVVTRGSVTSSFTVTPSMNEPTLQVSMPFVQPGGTFTSTGNAFKPGETVTFSLLGANVATATVGTTGNVPQTTINVPSCVFTQAKPCTSDFGPATLTATGGSSGKVSTATVDITNEWSQGGFGATRPNFEPYDSKIASDIDVGLNTILSLAWKYGTGAAVNASPIVVNGVVYVGNDNGVMSAVGTTSGAPLWTYTTPSGAPIRSSAAIDAAGNVVFGSNDGNLYEVSPSGGLVRTVALSGQLGSPAFAGNQIIVPSSNGNLYDVNDATGALTWTYTLGGAATAPAFDIANNLVVVGDSTGAITAIAGGTGTKQWSYTTGGAAAPPGIDGLGHVDVGSADGNMYQLKEITGGLIWKYAAGAAIQSASAVTASGGIQFGTANGTIILLKPTGKLLLQQEGSKYNNSPIVGIGGVNLNTFVETSSGLIGDTRNDANTPLFAWGYQTGAGFSSSPVVLDGAIYAGAGDGYLYTFTPHGSAPLESAHRAPAIAVTDGPANQWECAANE